jgi:hypothetical protein
MKWNLQRYKNVKAHIPGRLVVIVVVLLGAIVLTSGTTRAQGTTVTTANGTWTLFPALPTAYKTLVNQPINSDGSSNFPAKRGVIPVSFSLSTALGAPVFQSLLSDGSYSSLSFAPNTAFTFNQLTALNAGYTFTTGNCHGGALRWSVTLQTSSGPKSVFIYYGGYPNFTDCTTAGTATNQNGLNMIGQSDLRYDTSQLGGTFYDSYTDAVSLAGTNPVVSVTLVLDAGWGGDQVLNLGPVSLSTSGFTDGFVAPSGSPVQTCNLPTAQIQVIKTSGTDPGPVTEVLSVQPADNNGVFRIVSCKYMYNLDVSSLTGVGGYSVGAIISGTPVTTNLAIFMLK